MVWGWVLGVAACVVLDVSWWRWLAGCFLLRFSNECMDEGYACHDGLFVRFFRSGAGAGTSHQADAAVAQGRKPL